MMMREKRYEIDLVEFREERDIEDHYITLLWYDALMCKAYKIWLDFCRIWNDPCLKDNWREGEYNSRLVKRC